MTGNEKVGRACRRTYEKIRACAKLPLCLSRWSVLARREGEESRAHLQPEALDARVPPHSGDLSLRILAPETA